MKTINFFFKAVVIILFLSFISNAQDIKVHNYIGKKKADVVKEYGNPVHQDNSNPEMVCMFYKTASKSYIFVSNKEGVYQAEATASYNSETEARKKIDDFISTSLSNNFSVDTVSVSDFHLQSTGVKVDLQISENKLSKKYDIRVKATKSSS